MSCSMWVVCVVYGGMVCDVGVYSLHVVCMCNCICTVHVVYMWYLVCECYMIAWYVRHMCMYYVGCMWCVCGGWVCGVCELWWYDLCGMWCVWYKEKLIWLTSCIDDGGHLILLSLFHLFPSIEGMKGSHTPGVKSTMIGSLPQPTGQWFGFSPWLFILDGVKKWKTMPCSHCAYLRVFF